MKTLRRRRQQKKKKRRRKSLKKPSQRMKRWRPIRMKTDQTRILIRLKRNWDLLNYLIF
jgi:hypothetical protein